MKRFAIYCTPEQTKKALELGAPITTVKSIRTEDTILSDDVIESDKNTFTYVVLPTADEMIGWLEEQDDILDIEIGRAYKWRYRIFNLEFWQIMETNALYSSRKEATLAAIDAALYYLIKNKK